MRGRGRGKSCGGGKGKRKGRQGEVEREGGEKREEVQWWEGVEEGRQRGGRV